jgi:D-alanine-D-alanine ligase
MVTNKRIGVLAGGTSAERDVSLRSGKAVLNALVDRGYDAVFIDQDSQIAFHLAKHHIEIVFIALHGGHGENGAIQGLLDVMGIPYTGSGVLASALAMDKEMSKLVFREHGLSVAPYRIIDRNKHAESTFPFPYPFVVKPVSEGSSIGVTIVKSSDQFQAALDEAFRFGKRAVVEQYIAGREIQVGVLGDRALGAVEVRPQAEFYDYKAKYTAGMTDYILPPDVSSAEYDVIQKAGLLAHCALGCAGATRVDMILADDHTPYILEVNTVPGLTETSLLPKIAAYTGMSFADLIEEMLSCAVCN